MKKFRFTTLSVLLICLATLSNAQLVNGSFENYSVPSATWDVPGVVNLGIPEGDINIVGWTVINGNIDLVGTGWLASHGRNSLDFGGHPGSGGVSQTFATVLGGYYLVQFDLSGNPSDTHPDFPESYDPIKRMRVQAAGQFGDFSYDIVANGNASNNMRWQTQQFMFQATGTSTTLELFSTMPVRFTGPAIDNVTLTAVPEPNATSMAAVGLTFILSGYALRRKLRTKLNNE